MAWYFFCFVPLTSFRIWEFPSYLMDFSYLLWFKTHSIGFYQIPSHILECLFSKYFKGNENISGKNNWSGFAGRDLQVHRPAKAGQLRQVSVPSHHSDVRNLQRAGDERVLRSRTCACECTAKYLLHRSRYVISRALAARRTWTNLRHAWHWQRTTFTPSR